MQTGVKALVLLCIFACAWVGGWSASDQHTHASQDFRRGRPRVSRHLHGRRDRHVRRSRLAVREHQQLEAETGDAMDQTDKASRGAPPGPERDPFPALLRREDGAGGAGPPVLIAEGHSGPPVIPASETVPAGRPLRIAYLCIPRQVFPLVDYGGTEAMCEAEVEELQAIFERSGGLCVDFTVYIPARKVRRDYPFRIVETGEEDSGLRISGKVWIPNVPNYLNSHPEERPDVFWCQSEWCPPAVSDIAPVIATMHFGNDGPGLGNFGQRAWWRYPSFFSHSMVTQNRKDIRHILFPLHIPLRPDEFDFQGEPGEYFLWVAACGWERLKGLDKFMELAAIFPREDFRFYCSSPSNEQLQRWKAIASKTPNLRYMGTLERGPAHNDAFRRAKAFFMLSKMPAETFGRTSAEAMAKGTPVIGTDFGPVPEVVGRDGGFVGNGMDSWGKAIEAVVAGKVDRRKVYEHALEKFRAGNIVGQLLGITERLLQANGMDPGRFQTYGRSECRTFVGQHPGPTAPTS